MDSLLLHVCCAPCLATARETLRQDGGGGLPEVGGIFFFNPNIHPLLEFRRRIKALRVYLERDPVPSEIDDTYGLRDFFVEVAAGGNPPSDRRERCFRCYTMRLEKAARLAAERGMESFSTTLLASREQDRDLVALAGDEAGKRIGVRFAVADLRRHLAGEKMLRGIYKQQYCGCIFSEEERFRDTRMHIYNAGEKEP